MYKRITSSNFVKYPIEFKEINPEDFEYVFSLDGQKQKRDDFIIENNCNKIISKPNREGYINKEVQKNINLDSKNTVVINAAVGQGKSFAIIQTIVSYYERIKKGEKFLLIVASPFVSLVKQYCNDIHKAGVLEEDIFNYAEIGREEGANYIGKCVQVITANTLLGNPGEDAFKNSEAKREYLNRMVSYCKRNNIKVVFIYDEIHDSYHNFKQEYIFNLWKWKCVIHKNFILSATYNEASKVVIEYLAELTDFRIKIIESERKRFPDKQSSLYLHYSSSYNFTQDTIEIKNLVQDLISRNKKIDILCYSKRLAQSIMDKREDIGKMLHNEFGEINDCTSELISNQREENVEPKNQYNDIKCNVGTNFKTGVSIRKENHALVIIMPPRSTRLMFRNKYGIFSGGINSVIQAIARQRNKGEIHIILPNPDKFNFSTLDFTEMNSSQKQEFKDIYELVSYYKEPQKLVKYIKLNRQDFFLRTFYEKKLKGNLDAQIEAVHNSNRGVNLPVLTFPSFKEFKLESGEDFLANEYPIFGEDISAYLTFAAITNQFINCQLIGIKYRPVLLFKEGRIQQKLNWIIHNYSIIPPKGFTNFNYFYANFRSKLFEEFQLKYRKSSNNKIINIESSYKIYKAFELQLLNFTYKVWRESENIHINEELLRGEYFLNCISHSSDIPVTDLDDEQMKNKVKFYQLLHHFRGKLISSLYEHRRASDHYFCIPSSFWNDFFNESDKNKFRELLSLLNADDFLKSNVYEFNRRLGGKRSIKSKYSTFYLILLEDFLELDNERDIAPRINLFGKRRRVKVVKSIPLIPNKNSVYNLIESPSAMGLDELTINLIGHQGLNKFITQQEQINRILG